METLTDKSEATPIVSEPSENIEYEEFEEKPLSKGQVTYSLVVAFFAWMFSTYDFILFGTLLPVIALEFHWTTAQSAGIATWVSLGTFFISLAVGPITDYFGRRNALMITTAGSALSSGLTGFTTGPLYLILVRAFSGLGTSEQAVNTTYLSEIVGARKRGFLYSFVQGGWPIGVLFCSLITSQLLPVIGWRGVFWVGTLPAVIIVLLRIKLKESPKFEQLKKARKLMREGKFEQAKQFGKANGIDTEKLTKFSILQLFGPDIRRHTIFLGAAQLFNWFSIQIFAVLSTTVLTEGKGISFDNSLFMLIFSNAMGYIGYITHGYIGDRIGRRGTLIGSWIVGGLAYSYMLFFANGYWPVFISYTIGLFFLIGSASALFTYMGESFPTRVRGTGAAFINAMGPIGAILGSLVFTLTIGVGGVVVAAFVSGVIPLILAALLLLGAKPIAPSIELENISK